MQQLPLVVLEPWNGRPPPTVENAAGIDKNVTLVVDDFASGHVFDLSTSRFNRLSPAHFMVSLAESVETVLRLEVVKVFVNLSSLCVDARPIKLGLK